MLRVFKKITKLLFAMYPNEKGYFWVNRQFFKSGNSTMRNQSNQSMSKRIHRFRSDNNQEIIFFYDQIMYSHKFYLKLEDHWISVWQISCCKFIDRKWNFRLNKNKMSKQIKRRIWIWTILIGFHWSEVYEPFF